MTKNNGIVFQDVPFNKESLLVTYTDASWSNAPYSTSQLGILAMMTTTATRTQQHGSIIDWRSCRSPRVCRSTLAAAATAADEGADRAAYINMHISEILYRKPAHQVGGKLSYVQVTYAKSLYDCIIAPNSSLSDKRSLVNIRAIQEAVSPSQTRWVPTFLMFADGLTKISSQLRDSMSQWLQGPYVKLTEGSNKNGGVTNSHQHCVTSIPAWAFRCIWHGRLGPMPRQDPWPTFVSSQNGRAALSLPLHALPAALSLVVLRIYTHLDMSQCFSAKLTINFLRLCWLTIRNPVGRSVNVYRTCRYQAKTAGRTSVSEDGWPPSPSIVDPRWYLSTYIQYIYIQYVWM